MKTILSLGLSNALAFCILVLTSAIAQSQEIAIGPFSSSGLVGWQSKVFDGQTDYQLFDDDGIRVLRATSENQASALIYEKRIDLHQTPWLNWRWKIDKPLSETNETGKDGDDYSARVYVIVDGGVFRWRSKALNYVWSSRTGDIDSWPNAYLPKNAMMIALKTASDESDTWYTEKRNILQDFQKTFGKEIQYIDAIAIMTDTDNTGQTASGWYGDITFSSE